MAVPLQTEGKSHLKGTTSNDLGVGPGKKIQRPFSGEKNLYGRGSRGKINSFRTFPPPPDHYWASPKYPTYDMNLLASFNRLDHG